MWHEDETESEFSIIPRQDFIKWIIGGCYCHVTVIRNMFLPDSPYSRRMEYEEGNERDKDSINT